jgi:hypothetical protein
MASLPSAENQGGHAMTRDLKWSRAGRGIARKVFERTQDREFQAVIRTAKEMAGQIEQPADLWDLEYPFSVRVTRPALKGPGFQPRRSSARENRLQALRDALS